MANYYPKISSDLLIGASKVLKVNGLKNYKKILAPGIFEVPTIISRNIDNEFPVVYISFPSLKE